MARNEGGVTRIRRTLSPARVARREETWLGANEAKFEKLHLTRLRRRAGERGLALRHSAYGYALINSQRRRIDERSDMSLDEIESWLDRA